MYLKEVSIKNFKSFYGNHNFCFNKGINTIISTGREGKTNFCQAVEFALFGAIGFTPNMYSSVINERRVEEADSERDWIGCEVSLLFMDKNDEYRYNRSFSPFLDNEAREKVTYSTNAPKINYSEYHEIVYVDEVLSKYSHEDRSESRGYVAFEGLNDTVNKNISKGIGLLLLDNSLAHFSKSSREKALNLLQESALEQIILLMGTSQHVSTNKSSKIIRLGKHIESVAFKVRGFPFPSEGLLGDIDMILYDRYVSEGEEFKREVSGYEYTLEAVEVIPNGARYQRDTSKIIIT